MSNLSEKEVREFEFEEAYKEWVAAGDPTDEEREKHFFKGFTKKQPIVERPSGNGVWEVDNNGNLELEDGQRAEVNQAEVEWVEQYPKTGKAKSIKVKLATEHFMWVSSWGLTTEFGKKTYDEILSRCCSTDTFEQGSKLADIVVIRKGDWYNTYSRTKGNERN